MGEFQVMLRGQPAGRGRGYLKPSGGLVGHADEDTRARPASGGHCEITACRNFPAIRTRIGSLHGRLNVPPIPAVHRQILTTGNNSCAYRIGRLEVGGGGTRGRAAHYAGTVTARVPVSTGPDARRDGARSALVWDTLQRVVATRAGQAGRAALDIVDVGGGTGGFAVPFAALGHNVTVVDPSPDALAGAQRRAAERQGRLAAVQGDADGLDHLVGEGAADLVICHSVLEYVDEPAAAMAAIARVLRPDATVSVLAANAVSAVLHRALAGRYEQARDLLAALDGAGEASADGRRRYTLAGLTALIEGAGLRAGEAYGVRVFAGLLPAADPDPGAAAALAALEDAAAAYPALRDIAARLHVLGHR